MADRIEDVEGEESFEAMLDRSFAKPKKAAQGNRIEATVVAIGTDAVFLDTGGRSEGAIPRAELEKDGALTVKVGDTIPVYAAGKRDGMKYFTRRMGAAGSEDRKGGQEAQIAAIRDAFDAGIPVEGNVKEAIKGGFSINVMGVRAFCPISQIEKGYCEDPSVHVGRTYGFAVTEFGEDGRNVVLSRRRLLEAEAEEQAAKVWSGLNEGDVFEGVVTSVQKYGAFVDIGGVEGLVHVSEIAHTRVENPADVLTKGQLVRVTVLSLDRDKKKISLSMKELEEDPWLEALSTLHQGAVVDGKVTRIATFGAFVELAPGVEGLLHISRMGQGRRISNPREVVKIGDVIKVEITELDAGMKKVSLSLFDGVGEQEKAATEMFLQGQERTQQKSMGTLGDLFRKKAGK